MHYDDDAAEIPLPYNITTFKHNDKQDTIISILRCDVANGTPSCAAGAGETANSAESSNSYNIVIVVVSV